MKREPAKLEAKRMLWQQTKTENENLESADMKNTARGGRLKYVPGSWSSPWQPPRAQGGKHAWYWLPVKWSSKLPPVYIPTEVTPSRNMHTEMNKHQPWVLFIHSMWPSHSRAAVFWGSALCWAPREAWFVKFSRQPHRLSNYKQRNKRIEKSRSYG